MEKKSLFQQVVAGYQITLYADGSVSIHKEAKLIGQGALDSVVLTQWGEAHFDGSTARLGKSPEEDEEIYEQIDDALSIALTDEAVSSQIFLHRNPKQLTQLAEHWAEQLTATEKKDLLQNKADIYQKIRKAEFLSPEQAQALMTELVKAIENN